MANEGTLLILLLILMIGLIIPELLKKFRLPVITLVILAGALFGPHGLDYVQSNDTISFFGFLGMAFLMLMAGLETDISMLNKSKYKIVVMALLNGFVPCLVGISIGLFFGYSMTTSLLLGIIFISSSVAIIVPSLKEAKGVNNEVAHLILSAVIVADIISLVALGFIFQNTSQIANLPLPLYFIVLLTCIGGLFFFVPRISEYALKNRFLKDVGYERQLRFVLVLLIGTLTLFSVLGVHPILASFLAGLSLSGIIKKDKAHIVMTKLHTLGFGLFVPVFFFVAGMEMDVSLFKNFTVTNVLMIAIVLGSLLSKFLSGYIAGRIVRFKRKESILFGTISITQLTTTLAVTYSAGALGLLDGALSTAVILLAIISTFLGPLLTSYLSKRL